MYVFESLCNFVCAHSCSSHWKKDSLVFLFNRTWSLIQYKVIAILFSSIIRIFASFFTLFPIRLFLLNIDTENKNDAKILTIDDAANQSQCKTHTCKNCHRGILLYVFQCFFRITALFKITTTTFVYALFSELSTKIFHENSTEYAESS